MIDDRIIELPNHSNTPETRFEVAVADLVEAAASLSFAGDWTEVVLWHTHPSGFIGPSKIDMQQRVPQFRRQLVVALTEQGSVATYY